MSPDKRGLRQNPNSLYDRDTRGYLEWLLQPSVLRRLAGI
jgi:hypothetical protein